jgi:3D (Asp-Asp-Asp) domain-containing protein
MRINGKAISSLKKLAQIGGVAVGVVLTFGLTVCVSGHPTQNASPRISSVPQSTLPVQQAAKEQPELMHDVPADAQQTETTPVLSHRRIVKMLVTAYCPCPKCCGANASGITASGKLVTYNGGQFVAADSSLPFGTKLVIPGYSNGSVEVLDRGGAIRGNHLDVFFPTHQQALEWGRRTVEVTVLD